MERTLSNEQLQDFDTEYVDGARWEAFAKCVNRDFPDGRFTMLDIGGGNGVFADRVLDAYPNAHVTVLDNAPWLLGKVRPRARKAILGGDALRLEAVAPKFNLVTMNWLLHHLVGNSYGQSIDNIRNCLRKCQCLLNPGGRVSIYDNVCDGWLIDKAPSWLIYQLTASKALAPLARAGGANTAGVGVCFQSERAWLEHFRRAGLLVERMRRFPPFGKPLWLKAAYGAGLHLKPEGPVHFWLAPQSTV